MHLLCTRYKVLRLVAVIFWCLKPCEVIYLKHVERLGKVVYSKCLSQNRQINFEKCLYLVLEDNDDPNGILKLNMLLLMFFLRYDGAGQLRTLNTLLSTQYIQFCGYFLNLV